METGTNLDTNLYTAWKENDEPYFLLYISQTDTIKTPGWMKQQYPFFNCSSENEARQKETMYPGYHTFIYKSYATSSCEMNKRLISYRKESQCFIAFHELMHNYISRQNLNIPYEFNEALCDIMGNYGALQFSKNTKLIDRTIAEDQLKTNEKIYKIINLFIEKINSKPKKTLTLHARCEKRIQSFLKKGDTFQKDRFDYKINNAYLLKNKFYSQNYFLLKKVFQKQKTTGEFIELIKYLPGNVEDCTKYLSKYL
ncbi:MAG TPA: hypothetical protein VJY62_08385 [Bacteroidia bacterium]|nr:hypothetical protein [Bacteroidia bacterium]